MSSEFYKRNTALYEEFQRKELHYLNTERSLNSFMHLKNKSNNSLQDNLHKINQREKKNEETYRKLMNQIEEMDRRTEILSFNLEKLSILKNSIIASKPAVWNLTQDNFENSFTFIPPTSLNCEYNLPSSNLNKSSVSTQTENIYCDQCRFPLFQSAAKNAFAMISVHSNNTSNDIYNATEIGLPQTSTPQVAQDVTLQSIISMITPREQQEANISSGSPVDELPNSVMSQSFENSDSRTLDMHAISNVGRFIPSVLEENYLEYENQLPECTVSNNALPEVKEALDKKKNAHEADEYALPQLNSAKSDDESIKHEFDFLESEKENHPQINFAKDVKLEHSISNEDRSLVEDCDSNVIDVPLYASVDQSVSQKEIKDQIHNYGEDMDQTMKSRSYHLDVNIDDIRSESSISAAGPQSPSLQSEPASMESDLDSFFDKETPLTDTAAYQALLGNTSVSKQRIVQQKVTDSDSEDSVEKALAQVVRKSSMPIHESLPTKDEEKIEIHSPTDNEKKSRTSKAINLNGKQSEALKQRRKVLNFDSSGSEMEPEIKAVVKKNADDDDDDEFSF